MTIEPGWPTLVPARSTPHFCLVAFVVSGAVPVVVFLHFVNCVVVVDGSVEVRDAVRRVIFALRTIVLAF